MVTVGGMREVRKKVSAFTRRNKYFFYTMLLLSFVYGTVWLAFYPGVMTPDSLDQWSQVLAGKYNNGSPYISTFIMGSLGFIKETPAWLGLVQCFLNAFIVSLAVWYGHRRGVKNWVLAVVIGLFIFMPTVLLFNITLWKDILYSQFVALVSLLTAIAIIEKSKNKALFVGIGLAISVTATLRYNGIVYLIVPPLLLFLMHRQFKAATLYTAGSAVVGYLILAIMIPAALKIDPAPMMTEWLRMKNVGAIYSKEAPNITQEQKEIFERILPEEDWKKYYTCDRPDPLALREEAGVRHKYSDTFFDDQTEQKRWEKEFISAALGNMDAVVYDKVCMAGGFFQRKSPLVVDIPKQAGMPVVEESSKLPWLKTALIRYANWTYTEPVKYIVHQSVGFYTLLFVVALVASIWQRKRGLMVFAILNIANMAFMIAIGFSTDFRYAYSLLLGAILLIIMWNVEPKSPVVSVTQQANKTSKASTKPKKNNRRG